MTQKTYTNKYSCINIEIIPLERMAMPMNCPKNLNKSACSPLNSPGRKVNLYFSVHSPAFQLTVGSRSGMKHFDTAELAILSVAFDVVDADNADGVDEEAAAE